MQNPMISEFEALLVEGKTADAAILLAQYVLEVLPMDHIESIDEFCEEFVNELNP